VGGGISPLHAIHQHDMQSRQPLQCRPAQGRLVTCVGGRRRPTLSLVFSLPCYHKWRQYSSFTLPAAHRPPRHLKKRQRGPGAVEGAGSVSTQSTRLPVAAAALVTRRIAGVTESLASVAGGPEAKGQFSDRGCVAASASAM